MQFQSARSEKSKLTLIPEQDRSVDYRFDFVLVGQSCSVLAKSIVESEIAVAYRPTAKTGAPRRECVDEEDLKTVVAAKSTASRRGEDDRLLVYCPITGKPNSLARINFECVESFSQSLPLSRDPVKSLNQAVVFVFYPELYLEPWNFKSDFASRVAEFRHHPAGCKPYCVVFAIDPGDSEESLRAFADVNGFGFQLLDDGEEDTVMDALQNVCDCLRAKSSSATDEGSTQPTGIHVASPAAEKKASLTNAGTEAASGRAGASPKSQKTSVCALL